jgi:hypothetical protein
MAFDGIIEILVEAVARPALSKIVYSILYPIGKVSLRILTLGRYPPSRATRHNREFVAIFAFVPISIMILAYASAAG